MDDSNSQEASMSEQINPIFKLIDIPLNPKIVRFKIIALLFFFF